MQFTISIYNVHHSLNNKISTLINRAINGEDNLNSLGKQGRN
ncbi:hypothetical protein [Amphritea balenae]|nr:hypothetical protein [Amphritea balenae]